MHGRSRKKPLDLPFLYILESASSEKSQNSNKRMSSQVQVWIKRRRLMIRYVGFWGEGKTSVCSRRKIESLKVREHQRGFPIRPAWGSNSIPLSRPKFLLNPVILTLAEYRSASDLCATYRTSLSSACFAITVIWMNRNIAPRSICQPCDVICMFKLGTAKRTFCGNLTMFALEKSTDKIISCHQNHFSCNFCMLFLAKFFLVSVAR